MEPVQDICLPFTLDESNLRGRFVRLGGTIQEIISRHNYPDIINHLLGEMTALTVILASALKVKGRFTLQTASIGPVPVLVVDMDSQNRIRACARFYEDRLQAVIEAEGGEEAVRGSVPALMGSGHLAFTVEQEDTNQRYQGMVDLAGKTLAECAQSYFRQSEQLDTHFVLHATTGAGPRDWWVGGVMLQRLPVGSDDRPLVDAKEIAEEDWSRACILLDSVTREELIDISLPAEDLVYRLFHEDKPRGYDPMEVSFGCSCSREKIAATLTQFPKEEILDMREPGSETVDVDCQFCGAVYHFTPEDLGATGKP